MVTLTTSPKSTAPKDDRVYYTLTNDSEEPLIADKSDEEVETTAATTAK